MFELDGKCSWKRPTGFCRWPTSQHSEKKLEKDWWIWVWMAIRKPQINGKSPNKGKKTAYWKPKKY